ELAHESFHRLAGEDAAVETALELLGRFGPVAPDRLHPDEDDLAAAARRGQSGVALARAAGAVAHLREEEPQEENLELQLEPALDAVRVPQVVRQVPIEPGRQLHARAPRRLRVVQAGRDEERVRVAVQDAVSQFFDARLGPEEKRLAGPR